VNILVQGVFEEFSARPLNVTRTVAQRNDLTGGSKHMIGNNGKKDAA